MRWWPWRRRPDVPENGHARQAKADAEQAVQAAKDRWPEVHKATNVFASQVEAAFRHGRRA